MDILDKAEYTQETLNRLSDYYYRLGDQSQQLESQLYSSQYKRLQRELDYKLSKVIHPEKTEPSKVSSEIVSDTFVNLEGNIQEVLKDLHNFKVARANLEHSLD